MPRTATDAEIEETKRFIQTVIEPAIKKMVEHANSGYLKTRHLRIGASLEWVIDSTAEAPDEDEG